MTFKKKIIVLSLFSFMASSSLFAQDVKNDSLSYTPKMYAGLHVGSTGLGIQFSYPINGLIAVRAQGSFFPAVATSLNGTEEGAETTTNFSFNSGNTGLLADFSFFKTRPGIRFSLGAFYNKTNVSVDRSYYLASEDLNMGNLKMEFKPSLQVNPYVGVSFGNMKKSKRVFFSMDLGALYQGKPDLTFTGTGYIAPTANESNTVIIENNVNSVKFYPYINMQLNFKIK
jgi:hypothetical protein